jgi:trehalose utilization protein
MNILIYSEDVTCDAYPAGLHAGIAGAFAGPGYSVSFAHLGDIERTITREALGNTDVLLWWGHKYHDKVPDGIAALVTERVQMGLGFVALHSAHLSKPFTRLMGTSGTLGWRDGDRERLWVASPAHPIAAGVPAYINLENEEMYSEPFDIPAPEDTVFIGWFAGGEVFRSGVTFRRGYGKVFYFQPGHEEYPTYSHPDIQRILRNAAAWAAPAARRAALDCPNMLPAAEAAERQGA